MVSEVKIMENLKDKKVEILEIKGFARTFIKKDDLVSLILKKEINKYKLEVVSNQGLDLKRFSKEGKNKISEFILKTDKDYLWLRNCHVTSYPVISIKKFEFEIGQIIISTQLIRDIKDIPIKCIAIDKEKTETYNEEPVFLNQNQDVCLEKINFDKNVGFVYFLQQKEKIDSMKTLEDKINNIWTFILLYLSIQLSLDEFRLYDCEGKAYVVNNNGQNLTPEKVQAKVFWDLDTKDIDKAYAKFELFLKKYDSFILSMKTVQMEKFFDNKLRSSITAIECYARSNLRETLKVASKEYPNLLDLLGENIDTHLRRKLNFSLKDIAVQKYFINRYIVEPFDFQNKEGKKRFVDKCIELRNALVHLDGPFSQIANEDYAWGIYQATYAIGKTLFFKELDLSEEVLEYKATEYMNKLNMVFSKIENKDEEE